MRKYTSLSILLILLMQNLVAQSLVTIKTPTNVSIEAIYFYEVSSAELAFLEEQASDWINDYGSSATKVAPASKTYNCHCYAWHYSDGGGPRWVNAFKISGGPNIANYWSGSAPTYQTTTSNKATKVYYPDGDHSAVTTSQPGILISKWGAWPRYRHAWNDCPYTTTNLQYYNIPVTGSFHFCETANYNTLNISNATYSWSGNKVNVSGSDYFAYATRTSDGIGWIEVEISSPYSGTTVKASRKEILIGPPYFEITGETDLVPGAPGIAIIDYSVGDYLSQGSPTAEWSYNAPLAYLNGDDHKAKYRASSTESGSGFIYATLTNSCGSKQNRLLVEVEGFWFLSVFPNPANEYAELNFYSVQELSDFEMENKAIISLGKNNKSNELGEYEIQLWHERKGLVKKLKSNQKKLQIPTNSLEEGTYFLHVIVNGQVHKQQLVIQR